MIDGRCVADPGADAQDEDGRFVRSESQFRNRVERADAEPGRYHLYVSLACPWAHRTLIVRRLKGLEDAIGVSVVHWHMGREGWTFEAGRGVVPDPVHGAKRLHELYTHARSDYSGRVTVPVLWDRQADTIVSNESADIIRMLNDAFDECGRGDVDTCPEPLRAEIDAVNGFVYENVNNGVYKVGFASSQAAYEEAFDALFASLDVLEARLANRRFLVGDAPTEADWRLFTTLVRFDPVYFGHFKCNRNRLVDFPNLWGYTRDLYQHDGVADTVDLFHIQHHYYESHGDLNPRGIVPKGPRIDYASPHGRG